MNPSHRRWAAALLLFLGFPVSGFCCEPILPLFQLLAGSSFAGSAILLQSSLWLVAAVVLKAGSFALLERRISWRRGALFMVLANVVSTIPGLLVAAFVSSGSGFGILLALPVIFVLGLAVERRTRWLQPVPRPLRIPADYAMFGFAGLFVISAALYHLAGGVLEERSFAAYWSLKFLFVTLVAGTGMALSAVLEECVIAGLSRKWVGSLSFYTPVFRANYITLGAVLLVAALQMMPRRLQSPHFITSWFDTLLAALGVA